MLEYTQHANVGDQVRREIEEVLAQGRTRFQEYLFFRSRMHGTCVVLDGDIQSCASDEALYHEALVHPALLLHPRPRRVLIMGGGEGATAREVLRHPTVEEVVMVDIDEEFVRLCRQLIPDWGGASWEDPRLEILYQDINVHLDEDGPGYDVVIGDLIDIHDWDAPAAELYGKAFYERLKGRLNPGALLATQAGPLVPNDLHGHLRIRATLYESFDHVRSYGLVVPSFYHLWGFVLASDTELETDPARLQRQMSERARERGVEPPTTGSAALAAAFALPRAILHSFER